MTVVGPNDGFITCNLNHDQYDDLVLEYLHFDQSGLTYRLYGILGSPDLSNSQPITVDVQSDPVNLVVTGFNLGGWRSLGGENLGCGDVDGDGFQDLVIGAYGENFGEGITAGVVYVIRGTSEFTYTRQIAVQVPDQADVIIGGIDGGRGEYGDMLGKSLAVADVDGDGRDDLILGAPYGDGPYNNSHSIGEVYLWLGRALSGQIVDLSREAEWILYGDTSASFFGSAISAGDLDGDGRAEVIFGCAYCNKHLAAYSYGSGYIVDPERFHGEHMIKEVTTLAIVNSLGHSTLGFTVNVMDVDGDGELDMLIGSVIQDYPVVLYLMDYPALSYLYFPLFIR